MTDGTKIPTLHEHDEGPSKSPRRVGPRWWSADVEHYLVQRMGADPQVRIAQLRAELYTRFALDKSADSLAHALCQELYPRHPEIATARRAGLTRSARRSNRAETFRTLLSEVRASPRYATEVAPYLNERERLVVGEDASPNADQRSDALRGGARAATREQLIKKLERWRGGGLFLVRPKANAKPRVAQLVASRIARAGSFEALADSVGLSATEREVVARYVLGPTKVSLLSIARALDRKLITIVAALRSAGNKLQGKEGRHHLKEKYWRMFDRELEAAIASIAPKSRQELIRTNHPLYSVALARGVCDRVLPTPVGRVLGRLRAVAEERIKGESFEDLCHGLSPFEVGIFSKRVLQNPPAPLEYFRRAYGISAPYELARAERKLLAKLRRRPYVGKVRDDLRTMLRSLSTEALALLHPLLTPQDLDIIERRVRAPQPETLASMGTRWGVTRERVRQVEERLEELLRGVAAVEKKEGIAAVRAFIHLRGVDHRRVLIPLRRALAKFRDSDLDAFRRTLRRTELVLLDRRALPADPPSLSELATELSLSLMGLRGAERRLLGRALHFLGEEA